jgi:hypothetical protein
MNPKWEINPPHPRLGTKPTPFLPYERMPFEFVGIMESGNDQRIDLPCRSKQMDYRHKNLESQDAWCMYGCICHHDKNHGLAPLEYGCVFRPYHVVNRSLDISFLHVEVLAANDSHDCQLVVVVVVVVVVVLGAAYSD